MEVPKKLEFEEMTAYALSVASDIIDLEPSSYVEAMEYKDYGKWFGAMAKEIQSFLKNQTWELVVKPKGNNIVDCKRIYKYKEGIQVLKEQDVRQDSLLVVLAKYRVLNTMRSSLRW